MARKNTERTGLIFPDILMKLKRGPQVILPKDAGMIIAISGIGKESVCVDAGAGSGWLAVTLGNIAKKSHHLRVARGVCGACAKEYQSRGAH